MTADQSSASIPPADQENPEQIGLIALARQNPQVGFALAAIGLVILAFLAYLPVVRGEFIWQDDATVTTNPSLYSMDGLQRFWTGANRAGQYEPLTMTSYWLNFRFSKINHVAYHLTNIVFNIVAAMLLWLLLRRLDVPGAWVAAAAMALHPTHVQAVAWVSARGIVLASAFYFASMLVYLRFAGLTPKPAGEKTLLELPDDPARLWGISIFLFMCAVLSDPTVVTLPVTLLLAIWWKRGSLNAKAVTHLLPFFAVALIGAGSAVYMQSRSPAVSMLTAATGPLPVMGQLLDGGREIGFYALKTIAPVGLRFDYSRWQLSPAIGAAAWVIVLGVLVVLWAVKRRIGNGPFVGVSLFVVTLLPALGLLDPPALRYSFVADRLVYLASTGLIVLITAGMARFINSPGRRALLGESAGPVFAGLVLAALFVLSFRQSSIYATNKALWHHEIEQAHNDPKSWLVANNYGSMLLQSRLLGEAEKWFEKAHRIAPTDPMAFFNLARVASIRSFEAKSTGHDAEGADLQKQACDRLREAVRLDPDFAKANLALGELLASQKDDAGAAADFAEAVRADPDELAARLQYGAALRRLAVAEPDETKSGKLLEQAENTLNDLIDIAPNFAPAHTELGNVYLREHKLQPELDQYQIAVKLDPYNTTVLLNYGSQLDSSGEPDLAIQQFLAAVKLDPNLPQARYYLGRLQLKQGHRADAVVTLTRAAELDPSNAKLKELLEQAKEQLAKLGAGTPTTSQPTTVPQ